MSEYLPIQGFYHAHRLTASATAEAAFTRSLTSARVEMNPHQVDAALFALKAPYAKGVLLADEVGLGKTIEAGLVISPEMGGAEKTHPANCPRIASEAMATGTVRQVFTTKPNSGSPYLRRLEEGRTSATI